MNRQLVTVSALLALTCGLLCEEGLYLGRHPYSRIVGGDILVPGDPHCHTLQQHGQYTVERCELDGYNSALYMCKQQFCITKEPAEGDVLTGPEQRWLDHSADLFTEESSADNIARSGLRLTNGKP